jgi:hypothetical protein
VTSYGEWEISRNKLLLQIANAIHPCESMALIVPEEVLIWYYSSHLKIKNKNEIYFSLLPVARTENQGRLASVVIIKIIKPVAQIQGTFAICKLCSTLATFACSPARKSKGRRPTLPAPFTQGTKGRPRPITTNLSLATFSNFSNL